MIMMMMMTTKYLIVLRFIHSYFKQKTSRHYKYMFLPFITSPIYLSTMLRMCEKLNGIAQIKRLYKFHHLDSNKHKITEMDVLKHSAVGYLS